MPDIRDELLQFFTENYKPGAIGLVGTRDTIGIAIRQAQRTITADKKASLWSHCFIFGDIRLDRRGHDSGLTKSPYLFESDLKVNAFQPQLRNGAQENWIGKWSKKSVETAAVIDLSLTDAQKKLVLGTALQLVDAQVLYPIQELLGTWWAIIAQQEWKENPLNDRHAMYCSSFVRHCFGEAGRDFMDDAVSVSNTAPEHIARAGIKANAITIFQ
ncbi:MAG: hypothetical protein HZA17_11730 [Nitrospirae bacterium]|nr:hypothetical protein [Nitrospirota bacterium]